MKLGMKDEEYHQKLTNFYEFMSKILGLFYLQTIIHIIIFWQKIDICFNLQN